jgi:hypothetical protein
MVRYHGAIVRAVADHLLAQSGTGPLVFLEKFLALLGSGRFTATYKFATLAALIDVAGNRSATTAVPRSGSRLAW